MIYFMTGYASATRELATADGNGGTSVSVELRTVNSRFLDLNFRMPDDVRACEPALREMLMTKLSRGKVDVRINLQRGEQSVGAGALNRYELRAPFAGTIVEKHATPGEAIAADASMFVISDLSTVWAEMAVPAQRLNDVRVGRDATVSATAFESRSSGPIAYVGSLLGEQTRTAPARVVLPNPDRVWRPGMFVNVSVDAGRQGVPLAVASDALQDVDGAPSVFVRSPKGFVAQAVETGRRDERATEVLKGLKPGQEYAASNSFVLKAELGKGSAEHE